MFLPELSANRALLQAVRAAISAGLPVYAECGGLMYLCQRIVWGEQSASMVGALPFTVELTNRPQGHGYVMAQANPGNPFFGPGAVIRGHEFHNSRVVNWQGQPPPGYQLQRGHGLGGGSDGLVTNNVLAAYTHLHAAGAPGWAQGLVAKARNFAEQTHYASS
jgi:cobyrinic acid a,c-diamide synthase